MTRDELIEQHLDLVPVVVRAEWPGWSRYFDDLIAEGMLGLIAAADSFKPELGYKFSTFARACIKSKVLDSRRRDDRLDRGHRRRIKQGLEPDVPADTPIEAVDDEQFAGPMPDYDTRIDVERAVAQLSPREQHIIRQMYWRGRGQRVWQDGLSRSGRSQVHTSALGRLRAIMQGEPMRPYRRTA